MQKTKNSYGIYRWIISCCVFLAVAAIFWVGFTAIFQYTAQESMDQARDAADKYSTSLELLTKDMVDGAGVMADMARKQRTNDSWFTSVAQSVAAQNVSILGIQYTPLGRPPVSFPVGFSFGADKGLATAFTGLQNTVMAGDGTSLVFSPVVMQSGNSGVITMTPVFVYNSRTQNFDYLGNIAVLRKLPEAVDCDALKEIQETGYSYVVYGNTADGGNDGIIARSDVELGDNFVTASAKVPGGYWQIRLSPVDTWGSSGKNIGLVISLLAGFILGGLVFWILTLRQQRAESRRILRTDPLTKVGNRHGLKDTLTRLCHQLKGHFVIACMDIDNLKGINKTYGRKAGDAVLQETAKRVTECLKEDDRLFRVGDDSFVAIIDNESLEGVSRRLDGIRQQVGRSFEVGNADLKISIEVGCSAFPMDSRSPRELVMIADQRMNVKRGIVLDEGTDWLADDKPVLMEEMEENKPQ